MALTGGTALAGFDRAGSGHGWAYAAGGIADVCMYAAGVATAAAGACGTCRVHPVTAAIASAANAPMISPNLIISPGIIGHFERHGYAWYGRKNELYGTDDEPLNGKCAKEFCLRVIY